MSVLLHVSDTHFGTEQVPVVEALVRLAQDLRPDLLLLSGDITQRARRRQFRAAREFVDRLGIAQVLAIPGNHDVPLFNPFARLFAPYANHRRAFGHELEPTFESEQLLVLSAKTTRRYRHKHGQVSHHQIERVAARLETAHAEQLRIVVTHQPVCVLRAEDERDLLRGHEQALARWTKAGVDLILGGHIHLPFVCALHERDKRFERPVWAVQAGTAVSARIRREAPNSINVLHYTPGCDGRRCCIERWDYEAAQASFRRVEEHELRLAGTAG
jgi:3',5'-cyclic AMP phosphodiesterase CpdA